MKTDMSRPSDSGVGKRVVINGIPVVFGGHPRAEVAKDCLTLLDKLDIARKGRERREHARTDA